MVQFHLFNLSIRWSNHINIVYTFAGVLNCDTILPQNGIPTPKTVSRTCKQAESCDVSQYISEHGEYLGLEEAFYQSRC